MTWVYSCDVVPQKACRLWLKAGITRHHLQLRLVGSIWLNFNAISWRIVMSFLIDYMRKRFDWREILSGCLPTIDFINYVKRNKILQLHILSCVSVVNWDVIILPLYCSQTTTGSKSQSCWLQPNRILFFLFSKFGFQWPLIAFYVEV